MRIIVQMYRDDIRKSLPRMSSSIFYIIFVLFMQLITEFEQN
jgi:hypothetical protein